MRTPRCKRGALESAPVFFDRSSRVSKRIEKRVYACLSALHGAIAHGGGARGTRPGMREVRMRGGEEGDWAWGRCWRLTHVLMQCY